MGRIWRFAQHHLYDVGNCWPPQVISISPPFCSGRIPKQGKGPCRMLQELPDLEPSQIYSSPFLYDSTWYVLQNPPAPLKVGTPDSALTPAPVRTTTLSAAATSLRNSDRSELGLSEFPLMLVFSSFSLHLSLSAFSLIFSVPPFTLSSSPSPSMLLPFPLSPFNFASLLNHVF